MTIKRSGDVKANPPHSAPKRVLDPLLTSGSDRCERDSDVPQLRTAIKDQALELQDRVQEFWWRRIDW